MEQTTDAQKGTRWCAALGAKLFKSAALELSAPGWYCTTCARRKAEGSEETPSPSGVCGSERRVLNGGRYDAAHRAEFDCPPPSHDADKDYRLERLEAAGYDLYDTLACDGTAYVWDEPSVCWDMSRRDASRSDMVDNEFADLWKALGENGSHT